MRVIVFAVLLWSSLDGAVAESATPPQPAPADASEFGFATPDDALRDLRSRRGVTITNQGGWTVVDDRENLTLWSFTPPGHPAHPAGVKRTIVKDSSGNVSVVMSARCGASKTACDKLWSEFNELNNRMRQSIQSDLRAR